MSKGILDTILFDLEQLSPLIELGELYSQFIKHKEIAESDRDVDWWNKYDYYIGQIELLQKHIEKKG